MYNNVGEKIGSVGLSDKVFGGPVRTKLLRDAINMYEANKRLGTACTKTKGEVAGGGKKPWVQKHTGRARAGSIRSPLWKGGGVAFGPRPRDYSFAIPKKARKVALYSALAAKVRDGEMIIVDGLTFDVPKTKQVVAMVKAFGVENRKCLLVTAQRDENVWKSARNIPSVKVIASCDLNALEVLRSEKVLLAKDALEKIGLEKVDG